MNELSRNRAVRHPQRSKVEQSWEEDLLRAIGTDDVHAVSFILTRDVGGSTALLAPNALYRSECMSGEYVGNTAASYDINKLVLGMCVTERKIISKLPPMSHTRDKTRNDARGCNASSQKENKSTSLRLRKRRYTFVSYGAPRARFAERQWPNTATCLHVAVWSNAQKVVKYLLSLGASSARADALGVTAYERANDEAMRRVLRTPPQLQNLEVLDARQGTCLLRWTAPVCDPPLNKFRIRNLKSKGECWTVTLDDVKVFSRTRHELRTMMFQLPPASIQSQSTCQFDVQPCNEQRVWGIRSAPSGVVTMSHWLEDWDLDIGYESEFGVSGPRVVSDPFADEEQGEPENNDDEHDDKIKLVLGMMAFGTISKDKYFSTMRKIQKKSATSIQAAFRGMLGRDTARAIKSARENVRRRFIAAAAVQCLWRGYAVRKAKYDDQKNTEAKRASGRRGYRDGAFIELLAVEDDDDKWKADKHRYKCECKRASRHRTLITR